MSTEEEIIIISVGGSLICPDKVDTDFLKRFKVIIEKHLKRKKRFVLIAGGGRIARYYQEAARSAAGINKEDLDWIGIHATRINAQLLRTVFQKHAKPKIIKHPNEPVDFNEKILVGAGWKPGCSTDYDAVLLAKQLGVKKIINMSNIDYVYDKDPKKYSDAKPIIRMGWKDFCKKFGSKWSPGLNTPFDPVASKEAEANQMAVYIINGAKLENLDNLLEGKEFIGTTIS
ncbi:UMP kinase [Candidatus Woesearchaeota archaeon]|nr:UMP kinase [Candidatus Woesearchaeota archaeon]